jgi:hypothetical protein
MERYRELEKGFKKKQYSERSLKQTSKGNGARTLRNGQQPVCKKRMAEENDDEGNYSDSNENESDDDYEHGSDCNCGGEEDEGSEIDEDDEYGVEEEEGAEESPQEMTAEEAAKVLGQAHD